MTMYGMAISAKKGSNLLAILDMCPDVDIKSPGFIVDVAVMYLTLSPLATRAILAGWHGSY